MRTRDHGFTLVEVMVASSILVIGMALAMTALAYFYRGLSQAEVQNELDIDVQKAMERVKYDIRLSSLDQMLFYPPGPGPYTAVSFPIASDTNGDGAIEINPATGKIIWTKTMIYHVWTAEPSQLRLTTFQPRDNSLTTTQLQAQLNSVVTTGNGNATRGSANTKTDVVFSNLFNWSITPRASIYDGYAAVASRDVNATLGSALLTPGSHTLTFKAVGRNPSSTVTNGYKIGIDTLVMSPCQGEREGEDQLPAATNWGAVAVTQYMAGGSWSGNYQLYFPATATGQYFSLSMENDRWEESYFRVTGATFQDTTVNFDTSFGQGDYVCLLDGYGTTWTAARQTGDANGWPAGDVLDGCAVRVPIRGEQMLNGDFISFDGGSCFVNFKSGWLPWERLKIKAAYIGECATNDTPSMDVVASTQTRMTFGGSNAVTVTGDSSKYSDQVNLAIDAKKTYLVTFWVDGASGMGNSWRWTESQEPYQGCYVIPSGGVTTETAAAAALWSGRGDVILTNCLYAVQSLYTTYPTNGTYVSTIIDTHAAAPVYQDLNWRASAASGSSVKMKVRSANNFDMSDAPAWTNVAALTVPGTINPGARRYVQFQAQLLPDSSQTVTPKLRDVTLRWTGNTQVTDIGGTFTQGPDYGVFEFSIDGQKLTAGIVIDLEIFQDARGYRGNRRVTSSLTSEVTPRNSGR